MDYNKIEKKINENTKAIIDVDLAGIVSDYSALIKIAESKKALFIANNEIQKKIGRIAVIADFTSFSFHAVKNFTTAEGGAATWKDIDGVDNEELYKEYMLLSLHGQSKDALAKTQMGSWEYDIKIPGYKCNMTDIMAAIGLAQFRRYNQLLKRRKEIIEKYNQELKGCNVQLLDHYNENRKSSGHLYLVRVLDKDEKYRNDLIKRLAEDGIPTNVHYKPLPMMTAYKNMGFDIKDFPNSYNMYKNEITLPLHTLLSDEQVDYIIKKFKEYIEE